MPSERVIIPGSYFFQLKRGVRLTKFLKAKPDIKSGIKCNLGGNCFAGDFDEETVKALRADPDVTDVEEDYVMYLF